MDLTWSRDDCGETDREEQDLRRRLDWTVVTFVVAYLIHMQVGIIGERETPCQQTSENGRNATERVRFELIAGRDLNSLGPVPQTDP